MRVAIAADHGGAALKAEVLLRLVQDGFEVADLGGDGSDPTDDYPDYAWAVGEAVRSGHAERGIVICGSGVGAAVAASKMTGIRASVAHDTYSARQGVEHDDLNVLCLGARVVGVEVALDCARAFLGATFTSTTRYERRLAKVRAIEATERSTPGQE